jgi:acyl-CoA thioester hydrolase
VSADNGHDPPEGFRHFADLRVRYAETDAQGIVYHSNYLIYCEVGRMEYFRTLRGGGDEPQFRRDKGYDMVLAHAECDYRSSAQFDDPLRVWVRAARLGRSSVTFEYKIVHRTAARLVCEAKTVQVAIRLEPRGPTPLPPGFVARLEAFEQRRLSDESQTR